MSRKMTAFLIFLFAAPIVVYLIWPSDESRIRKLFREGAAAVHARKTEDVMAKVSFNFTDEHGLSYLYLKEGLARLFTRFPDLRVDYTIRNIEVRKDGAAVEVEVRVIAGRGPEAGYIAGDAADPLKMKFHLEKDRTTWMVVRTEGLPLYH
ncbi:MAG: hypothetical protein HZB33_02260 [Nitrospirae bacterium]|nr:hypothetical protein [Nitrospirota bacterium]